MPRWDTPVTPLIRSDWKDPDMGLFKKTPDVTAPAAPRSGFKRPVILPDHDKPLWMYSSEAKHIDTIRERGDLGKYEDRDR